MKLLHFAQGMLSAFLLSALTVLPRASAQDTSVDLERGLVAHWTLEMDGTDRSSGQHHAAASDLSFVEDVVHGKARRVAHFNGRGASLEVPGKPEFRFGRQDFSVSLWLKAPRDSDDLPGDLLSHFDPQQHRGWQLSLKSNVGVTFNQANHRLLQFGVDQDFKGNWIDRGRPGQALLAFALAVHEGSLYAGTCEPGAAQSGRVYRFANENEWIDCGAPDRSNAVTSMAVFGGRLYVGTGKYRVAGSSLPESENTNLGGRVFRYEGGTSWTDCGQLPSAEAVGGLIEFRGKLYASSLYKPAGFFRYEQEATWVDCGVPNGKRVEALCVFNGFLYATSYDGGKVYRFDGQTWTDCGQVGENTQTYAFAVYQQQLYVGSWPSGRVYRFDAIDRWTDVGRLGEELEVMGMMVYQGRLLAGTLPSAQVYEFDGLSRWQLMKQLDTTPNVKYRRAWAMAEHRGQLFCSTLPSGRVHSIEIGKSVGWEESFPDGWHHVVAERQDGKLKLIVDGRPVAESADRESKEIDLTIQAPFMIGRGMNDSFCGRMSDVRVYNRALTGAEVKRLGQP